VELYTHFLYVFVVWSLVKHGDNFTFYIMNENGPRVIYIETWSDALNIFHTRPTPYVTDGDFFYKRGLVCFL
jgi:hypothetical protein